MIILLTGPTGAGKTDTSWALLERAAPMVFLDCDWFASRQPFCWNIEADVESVYQALSVMLDFHIRRGPNRFVIPLTLEMAQSYSRHRRYFDRFGLPVYRFRLACNEAILRERILSRDRSAEQRSKELAVVAAQVRTFETLDQSADPSFLPIDVSAMGENAVANAVLDMVAAMR